MAKTHFFHYHLRLSSQISTIGTFDQGFLSFTSPPLLLFHANSFDLVPNVFGSLFLGLYLYFQVWVFVCVSNVKGTFDKTHELCHHHQQCQHRWLSISILFVCLFVLFFLLFFFFSLLVWFFVYLGLGQFTNWVFLCDIGIS